MNFDAGGGGERKMAPAHRLENALARAEELIVVGQKGTALQVLHDAVMSKWMQNNQTALESIMCKFVELAVDLRRGRTLKDGLHQYRSACMGASGDGMGGLERVIRHLVSQAESRCPAPSEESSDAPWSRFLWEVYRVVLDICRHNTRLESLYKVVTEQAFSFCDLHGRKSEFRRLCELLRHHLTIVIRYPTQTNGIVLTDAESHRCQLSLRFAQLDLAMKLELWQEAFRTIEDIYGLFSLLRKAADPLLVRRYYEAIGQIFMMSDNHLFLAATWNKLQQIASGDEKASRMSCLATLAIPKMQPVNLTCGMGKEEREGQEQRLAVLLGLGRIPSAASLLSDLSSRHLAIPAMEPILAALQRGSITPEEYASLSLVLDASAPSDEVRFHPAIRRNLVALLLTHLSRHASVCSLPAIAQIVGEAFPLERTILEACKTGDFAAKIDQRAQTVTFERPCFARPPTDLSDAISSSAIDNLYDLTAIVQSAHRRQLLRPDPSLLDLEHSANLGRKAAIERRKELLEQAARQREQDDARERSRRAQHEQESLKQRELEEAKERERIKLEAEREEIRRQQAALRLAEIEAAKAKLQQTKDAEKLAASFKRLDHLERAIRQEERPLLSADYDRQKTEDRHAHEERSRLILDRARSKHAADLQVKQHLPLMTAPYQALLATVKASRLDQLATRRPILQAQLEEAKEARRQDLLATLRRRHDLQLAAEKLRAERAEVERQALERARQESMPAQVSTPPANAFGRPSFPPTASKPAGNKYVPPSARSAAAPQSSSPFGSRATPSSAFGSSPSPSAAPAANVWRRPGADSADSKSAFGSSRRP